MRLTPTLSAAGLSLALCGTAHAQLIPAHQSGDTWFTDAESVVEAKASAELPKEKAKNVILFVGDGMGISTLTAARILEGQLDGADGEENFLSFESFPYSAQVKTYNTNQQTPDSAGTMTAMISGVKTKAGVIGLAEDITRQDCESSLGFELPTLLDYAELSGLSTGVISTARITHATPAATYTKSAERNWEDISDMGDQADKGCKDIADQLVNYPHGDGIDVVFGGGRRHFLPNNAEANIEKPVESGAEGDRTDDRNLIEEWQALHPEGEVVHSTADFNAIGSTTTKVLGLFNESHMLYEADRSNDILGEPSLSEMTAKAIEVLSQNDQGYLLVVESGRIDHGHHAGSAYNALTDTVELSKAVQAAVDATSSDDTLIVVTADHSHVFTIAGYPTRGNPILGKVIENNSDGSPKTEIQPAADGNPYTTLGYTNGLGFADIASETDADARYGLASDTGRKDLSSIDTEGTGYHQEALVPTSAETHAGEDISVHAMGPSSHLFQGVIEQSVVFHVMSNALFLAE